MSEVKTPSQADLYNGGLMLGIQINCLIQNISDKISVIDLDNQWVKEEITTDALIGLTYEVADKLRQLSYIVQLSNAKPIELEESVVIALNMKKGDANKPRVDRLKKWYKNFTEEDFDTRILPSKNQMIATLVQTGKITPLEMIEIVTSQ